MTPTTSYTYQSPIPTLVVATVLALASVTACDTTNTNGEDGPNAPVGGSTTTGYTNVGDQSDIYTDLGLINPVFIDLRDSVVVVKNDNGNVTWFAQLTFDTAQSMALDTILGLQDVPADMKRDILDTYLARFGATLDTSDKDNMVIKATISGRVTSEGIQEYMTSGTESKPFTIIRFDAKVGDTYEMTRASDGVKVKRTVTYKSEDDDYPVGFWLIKVFRTEEVSEDPLVEKITYITNHKFGLVGMELLMKDGTKREIQVWPPNL